MLLVIFGAGATYDSWIPAVAGDEQHRPPLAAQLVNRRFDPIADRFPASRPVIDRLREKMSDRGGSTSLEEALAEISSSGHMIRKQQLTAFRFYLQAVITESVQDWNGLAHGQTHYLRLLNHLLDWHLRTGERVLLMTFNYDTLLEDAASVILPGWGLESPTLDSYVDRPDFRIFKVHGSTSWRRVVPWHQRMLGDQLPAAMQFAAHGGDFNSGEVFGNPPPEIATRSGSIQVPALAVPMAGKTDFECPPKHIEILKADLPEVKHVLVVGWRAAESHAVNLLRGGDDAQQGLFPSYDLSIVSDTRDNAAETLRNLADVGRKGRPRLVEDTGFSSFMQDIDFNLNELLNNPDSPHSRRG